MRRRRDPGHVEGAGLGRLGRSRQRDGRRVHGERREARADGLVHRRLGAPPEVLGEEGLGGGVLGELVRLAAEAVAFVLRHDVLDRIAAVAQRDHDLVALGLLDARVVRALDDEEGRRDPVGRAQRALRLHPREVLGVLGVADARVEDRPDGLPVGRDRGEQRRDAGRADDVDAGRVEVRREGEAGERGVAAVRAAHDADAVGVGDALLDEPLRAVGQVVLHGARAPLAVARVEVVFAVARRAAEVGLQHGVAAVGEKLRVGVVAPAVARPRPAVDQQDGRQVLAARADGQREVGGDLASVAGGVADGPHRRERLGRELGARRVEQRELARVAVEKVARARVGVAVARDEPRPLVLGRARGHDLAARELRVEKGEVRGPGVVPRVDALAVAVVDRRHEFVGDVGEDGAAEVHLPLRVALDERLLAGLGVEEDELDEVAVAPGSRPGQALVGLHVDAAAVRVEAHRPARLHDRARVDDLAELAVADAEQLGRAVGRRAEGQADVAVEVRHPARDALRVFDEQLALARLEVDAVDVVPGRVAVVEADQDVAGVALGHVQDDGARAVGGRQVARRRHALGAGGRVRVDGPDVVVLVAALVLDVEHVALVAAPEEARHGAVVGGERARRLEGLVDALDPDVHHAVERLAEREVGAVGRELGARDLGVPEEDGPVEELGELGAGEAGRRRGDLGGRGGRQQEKEEQERAHGRGGDGAGKG